MLPVPTFVILSMPHPLAGAPDIFAMGQGCSIEDVLLEAAYRAELPVSRFADAVVIIGDTKVEKSAWATTRPFPGQQVLIKVVPAAPAIPLIAAVAAYAAPVALSLTGWAAVAVSTAITLVGSLLSMALSPAPRQSRGFSDRKEAAVQSIQGVANQARPYGTIPRIFGRVVNYYPPLATNYYTEISSGNHQYMRVVFCLGYGPLRISNMKIGNTPLGNFEGVTYQVREGYPDDDDITLFPGQVREQTLNIELRQTNGYSQRRSEVSTDEISLDVVFPDGLQRIGAQNAKFNLEVEFEVQYKLTSSSSWSLATLSTDAKNITASGPGRFTIRGNTKVTLRRTVRLELPARGTYDVRIRRLTTDDQSTAEGKNQTVTVERSYWTALRSHRNDHPVNATGLAFIALRIRASDQLNGVIDQFNCTVESLLPVWNGSAWSTEATRSPAWAFCEVLRGDANARPSADSRIDLDQMLVFDEFCTDEGITFDATLEERNDVDTVLRDIAGTAYAAFSQSSGPFTVVIDNERPVAYQHWTVRNSKDIEVNRVYARRPHAIKVRYPSERAQRQWAEVFVYADGYSASNATLFESLELPYTSTGTQAIRRGRHAMAAAELRPRLISLSVDAEFIVSTPGDRNVLFNDVLLAGVGSARVRSLATSGLNTTGVVLDAPLPMEAGQSYVLTFRLGATGENLQVPVVTVAGESATFTFQTAVVTADGPAVDDLASLGEGLDVIVHSIEPGEDLRATMTFVDYAPAIFTSKSGNWPDFDPNMTLPPIVNRGIPVAPSITSIDSSEAVLVRASDGTLTSRIVIGFTVAANDYGVRAEEVQARYRPADTDQDFEWMAAVSSTAGSVSIAPVDDGATYAIELRSRFAGVPSLEWTVIEHTVVGKTTPPPDVDRLYRQGDTITWPYPDPPLDHAGFLVRANYGTSTDWSLGRPLHQGIITAPPFDISDLHGPHCIMVKPIDTSGIEATIAASLTTDLGDLYVENVIDTQSEAPGFTGTITGGSDTGATLEADIASSERMYPAAGRFYPASGPLYPANVYEAMTYIAQWSPASDQLTDALLKLEVGATGEYTVDYRIRVSPALYPVSGPFYPASGSLYGESEIGEFTPWPGVLGPFDDTSDIYEIRVSFLGGATQGVLSQMDLIVDTPDIEEFYEDVQITVAASGVRLTPAAARRAIDLVNVTLQDDGGSAVTVKIIDKNPTTGALIKAYNAAGTVTTATFDARTKAH